MHDASSQDNNPHGGSSWISIQEIKKMVNDSGACDS
jgi:hypothetical protein